MKRFKLMLSTFCLAIVLTFAGGASINVYASGDNPQGKSGSTHQPTPEPPPPSIVVIITLILSFL